MSYTPTTWETGDTITSAKLNKIEAGIVAVEGEVDATTPTFTDANNDGHIVIAFPATS